MRTVACRLAGLLAVLTCAAACGPFVDVVHMKDVPTQERAAAAKVRLIPTGAMNGNDFEYVGPVEATSCKSLLTDPPASRSDAIEQLRYKAMLAGANAVMDFSCTGSGTDTWGTNCWNSVQCGGTAISTH